MSVPGLKLGHEIDPLEELVAPQQTEAPWGHQSGSAIGSVGVSSWGQEAEKDFLLDLLVLVALSSRVCGSQVRWRSELDSGTEAWTVALSEVESLLQVEAELQMQLELLVLPLSVLVSLDVVVVLALLPSGVFLHLFAAAAAAAWEPLRFPPSMSPVALTLFLLAVVSPVLDLDFVFSVVPGLVSEARDDSSWPESSCSEAPVD